MSFLILLTNPILIRVQTFFIDCFVKSVNSVFSIFFSQFYLSKLPLNIDRDILDYPKTKIALVPSTLIIHLSAWVSPGSGSFDFYWKYEEVQFWCFSCSLLFAIELMNWEISASAFGFRESLVSKISSKDTKFSSSSFRWWISLTFFNLSFCSSNFFSRLKSTVILYFNALR